MLTQIRIDGTRTVLRRAARRCLDRCKANDMLASMFNELIGPVMRKSRTEAFIDGELVNGALAGLPGGRGAHQGRP